MWDGRVSQCHSDYLEKNILGDARKQSLKEIWKGREFERLRALMRDAERLTLGPCQTCCDGGETKEEAIQVGDRKIKMNLYVDQQLDIKAMDARLGSKR